MGLLSFMIWARENSRMAAQTARATLPGVVYTRVWNQSLFRKYSRGTLPMTAS